MILEISLSDFKPLCWNEPKIDCVSKGLKTAIQTRTNNHANHSFPFYNLTRKIKGHDLTIS